jgi:acyl-CoA synthetase (AMP-forming)/AMP-acid ligase II
MLETHAVDLGAPNGETQSQEAALPPHESLVSALEAAAREGTLSITLHLGQEPVRLSGRDVLEGALRRAALLRSRGVARGDRVVLLTPTSPVFIETFLGANLIGAIPVPLASPMTFGTLGRYLQNLRAILQSSGARVIMTSPRMREAIAEDEQVREQLDHVLCEEDTANGAAVDLRPVSVSASDTAFIQYTSGTTGQPKGAVISHRALVSNTYAIMRGVGITNADVVVSWLPMFHDMGLIGVLLTSICHPLDVHLLRPESCLMKTGRWVELIAQKRGTLAAAPNFAYDLCVNRPPKTTDGLNLASWRVALNGSEAVHPSTVKRFCDRFAKEGFRPQSMMPVYGMAETTLAITFPDQDNTYETLRVDRAALEQRGQAEACAAADAYEAVSVGRPVAGMSVRVTSPSGQVVAERTVGEVRVAGPSLMDGYFHNEEATLEALTDGWLRTGDLGFVQDGRLYIVGRAKEVIIKGGRNFYPNDIEQIASEIAGVSRGGVAAFARPNAETGTDDLVVVAETREKDPASRDRMVKEIRGELLAAIGVKADEIRVVGIGALPRTTSGKIRRKECARKIAQGEFT